MQWRRRLARCRRFQWHVPVGGRWCNQRRRFAARRNLGQGSGCIGRRRCEDTASCRRCVGSGRPRSRSWCLRGADGHRRNHDDQAEGCRAPAPERTQRLRRSGKFTTDLHSCSPARSSAWNKRADRFGRGTALGKTKPAIGTCRMIYGSPSRVGMCSTISVSEILPKRPRRSHSFASNRDYDHEPGRVGLRLPMEPDSTCSRFNHAFSLTR
jgi:hypothetical protein